MIEVKFRGVTSHQCVDCQGSKEYIHSDRICNQTNCTAEETHKLLNGRTCTNTCAFYSYDSSQNEYICSSTCDYVHGNDSLYPSVMRCESDCSKMTGLPYKNGNVCLTECDSSH